MTIHHDVLNLLLVATMVAAFDRFGSQFWLFTLLTLPGTFGHELMHWLMSFVLNGKPGRISVWPRRNGNEWVLGEVVTHHPKWYNMAAISLAPLLLLPVVYFGYLHFVSRTPLWSMTHWLGLYVMAAFIHGAMPSVTDLRLAAAYPIPFYSMALAGGIWLLSWVRL